ncbi:MAG: (2Fe-2S)-binding protein [Deltaproteobacteria bacterium]|nr:(2Fe-2S)-binding protein [Deltaproteobacteria bacterium]
MTVEITINGVKAKAEAGENLLEVIRRYGFEVPSLCHHHALKPYASCRVCLVSIKEANGRTNLTTSCNYKVEAGIEVSTESKEIHRNRKTIVELMLAEAPNAPEVLKIAAQYDLTDSRYAREKTTKVEIQNDGCILCGLCVRVCEEVVGVSALNFAGRGDKRVAGTPYMETPQNCIACGSCAYVCPAKCIGYTEEDGMRKLKKWDRELPMDKDANGRPFAPRLQLNHFIKTAGLDKDFYKNGGGPKR